MSNNSGPCGACKFLRRKCVPGCIFAPYFDSDQGAAHFAAVHKVFGASNVSKLLHHIPLHNRLDAVLTICYQAQARLRDPVYGCVAHIFALQQQVMGLQTELSYLQGHVELPSPSPALSISDMGATYDLSSLFQQQQQQRHLVGGSSRGGHHDLQALPPDLLHHRSSSPPHNPRLSPNETN